MLAKLVIRNFKRLADVTLDLGKSVVLIGSNNSGKTSALQALTLWDVGLRQWMAKRGAKARPEKRPGVAINRRDQLVRLLPADKTDSEINEKLDLIVRVSKQAKPRTD